jgi:hypothetical protein
MESRQLSNGITVNNYFQDLSRIVHTQASVDKDLYGRLGMVFIHAGGVQGMVTDLKRILADDFSRNLNRECYQEHSIPLQPALQRLRPIEEGTVLQEVSPSVEQQPLLTLYDLFRFREEERKQLNGKKRGRKKTPLQQSKPIQLGLFSSSSTVNTAIPERPEKTAKNSLTPVPAYPVSDARREALEKQLREWERPRKWSGSLSDFCNGIKCTCIFLLQSQQERVYNVFHAFLIGFVGFPLYNITEHINKQFEFFG